MRVSLLLAVVAVVAVAVGAGVVVGGVVGGVVIGVVIDVVAVVVVAGAEREEESCVGAVAGVAAGLVGVAWAEWLQKTHTGVAVVVTSAECVEGSSDAVAHTQ